MTSREIIWQIYLFVLVNFRLQFLPSPTLKKLWTRLRLTNNKKSCFLCNLFHKDEFPMNIFKLSSVGRNCIKNMYIFHEIWTTCSEAYGNILKVFCPYIPNILRFSYIRQLPLDNFLQSFFKSTFEVDGNCRSSSIQL